MDIMFEKAKVEVVGYTANLVNGKCSPDNGSAYIRFRLQTCEGDIFGTFNIAETKGLEGSLEEIIKFISDNIDAAKVTIDIQGGLFYDGTKYNFNITNALNLAIA